MLLLESELLLQSARENNPAYQSIMSKQDTKTDILSSLDYLSYLNQTNTVNTIEKK
jgi:hypothetical protein